MTSVNFKNSNLKLIVYVTTEPNFIKPYCRNWNSGGGGGGGGG